MNRTLRSNKKNATPNVLGIVGRELTARYPRFYIPECYKTEGGPYIFLDHANVHDPALLPTKVAFSAADILAESGIYTWILTKVDNRFTVMGSKALTEYELGSKHRDLYFDAGEPVVYAAGEVQVLRKAHELEVIYNLESGTFMKEIEQAFANLGAVPKTPTNYYKAFMEPLWAEGGATIIRYTDKTLIPKLSKTLTKAVIEGYRRAGYIPYQFGSQVECDLYRLWNMRKTKMGEGREFLTYLKEEFPDFPEQYLKNPAIYVGGKQTRRQLRKRTKKQNGC